jgi:hypothetical protein
LVDKIDPVTDISQEMPPRGRPRLTPAEYEDRLQSYCLRYGVAPTAAGIPPFPTGRRETDQHREWLALYKAHARLAGGDHPPSQGSSRDGSCGVCGRPVEAGDAVVHRSASLHSACHAAVALLEPLGSAGLDRLRAYLWPAQSNKSRRQRVK